MKKVLISSCLLGVNVKYNGGNNSILENKFIQILQKQNCIISICPEVDGGLSVPRIQVELVGNKAINKEGIDKTKEFKYGAKLALDKALSEGVKMAIMKSKSPSCGKDFIYDGSFTKILINKEGLSVALLRKYGIKIFSEEELEDAYNYWKKL